MARKVFFSFYYDGDIRRVVQVRNSWRLRASGESQPFLDKAEWEKLKRTGDKAVENWIERQLAGTSVTVVLYGKETASRPWVIHEIKRSYALGKGIIAIAIHNVKDPQTGTDSAGTNPLGLVYVERNGSKVYFDTLYKSYDWVANDGYSNLAAWIEQAALAAGR